MKKTISIFIMIILIIAAVVIPVQAATATVDLKSSSSTLKPGDAFTVTLSATCTEGINGIIGNEANDGFNITFDSNKLELVSRESKILTDANEGTDTIALAYFGNGTITSGDVYVWNFKVKDNAEVGNTEIATTSIIVNALDGSEATIEPKRVTIQIENTAEEPSNTTNTTNTIIDTNTTNEVNTTNTIVDTNTTNEVNTTNTSNISNTSNVTFINDTDKQTIAASNTKNNSGSLPYTGERTFVGVMIVIGVIVAIVAYRKVTEYKNI